VLTLALLLGLMIVLGVVMIWAGRTDKPQMGVEHDEFLMDQRPRDPGEPDSD
jgi:hypothetical protein